MRKTERTGFYFALPRLCCGLSARTERNWPEAMAAGALVYLVGYFFAHQFFLGNATGARQVFWALPLAFLVWVGWLLVLYFNSLAIRFLRALGFLRTMPDRHAQSLLIGILITFCSWRLLAGGTWREWIGILWMAALALNLLAALLLRARTDGVRSTTG